MSPSLSWSAGPSAVGWPRSRRAAAWVLRRVSLRLLRLARHLARPAAVATQAAPAAPTVEFHAEAGAPEGALFLDGVYVGQLEVPRL